MAGGLDQAWDGGAVTAVGRSASHGPGKPGRDAIRLLAGLGVEGDAHCGATVPR